MLRLALKTLTLVLFSLPFAAPAAAETFAWQGEAAAINLLHIDIRKGDILVRRSRSDRIEVSAVKRGRDLEVRQVKIEVEESASGVRIRDKLGSGGRRLGLATVNGDLELTRRKG